MFLLWEKFKAWGRGERMISGASRGRCFEKINSDSSSGSPMKAKATAKVEILKMKVIRRDGSVEEIDNG